MSDGPTSTPQSIEEYASMSWLQSMLFPEFNDVAPPEDAGRIFIPKPVTIDGSFDVNDTLIGASTAKIPTQRGMVMVFPNRGIQQGVIRFGFVPTGTTLNWGVYAGMVSDIKNWNASTTTPSNQNVLQSLIFGSELVLPYAGGTLPITGHTADTRNVVSINPNLPESFAFTSTVGTVVYMYSDTVPIGDTALNGQTSAAALATTQDVAQTNAGAYTPAACEQAAVLTPDAVLRNTASDGVVALQGPDISSTFVPPDSERHDQMSGIWAAGNDPDYEAFFNGEAGQVVAAFSYPQTTALNGIVVHMAGYFVTPWDITLTSNNPPLFPVQNIRTGPIGEMDNLDIDVYTAPILGFVTTGVVGSMLACDVVFMHGFATCGTAHEMNISWQTECETIWQIGSSPGLSVPQFPPGYIKVCTRPKIYNTDFMTRGKYIGTAIQIRVRLLTQDTSVTGTVNCSCTFSPSLPTRIAVRARTSGLQSSVGPVRVLQWNSMSNGQIVRVTGRANVIAVPNAALAPFVQTAGKNALQALNYNAKLWASVLYKTGGDFRRVMTRSQYNSLKEKYGTSVNPETITLLLTNDHRATGAASAAGCFQAGSIFGNLGSAIGQQLGRAGGNLLGGLFGAEGEFGNYSGPSASGAFAGGGAMSRVRQRY